ncbi:MAG: hypothetical protein AAB606_03080, partial [Patescibacteria group bacterium]
MNKETKERISPGREGKETRERKHHGRGGLAVAAIAAGFAAALGAARAQAVIWPEGAVPFPGEVNMA